MVGAVDAASSCIHNDHQSTMGTTWRRRWRPPSGVAGFCRPGDTNSLRKLVDYVAAITDWMHSNRLHLNASKTDVLWCASARRFVGCWLWSCVACQMRARSQYFHWRWPDAYPSHSDMFDVFCCLLTTMKHTLICVKRHDAVAHRGTGVFQAWLRLRNFCRPSEATHGQASVYAECCCTADLQSLSLGPHSAVTAQVTLASNARTHFVPAGSANVLLPPRLCTWLPCFRSSARVTPQRTSTTELFDYISAGHSTHCAFYHWRPHLSSNCCIGLEQFARVSPVIAVVASFPQQTEIRTFCPVLQPWLRTSHCTDYYYVTSLFKLIVTCSCSLRT